MTGIFEYRAPRDKWAIGWKPCKDCGGPVAIKLYEDEYGHIYPQDAWRCGAARPQDEILVKS